MNKYDWHSEAAFARPASANPNNGNVEWEQRGLSAWDYFAAHAPVPRTGAGTDSSWIASQLAECAAEYADAMMLERASRCTAART